MATVPMKAAIWSMGTAAGGGNPRDSGALRVDSKILVSTNSGQRHETFTGVPSSSSANDSDNPTTAYLVAWYGPSTGEEVSPASEAVLTTYPSPCSSIRGTKALTP